MEKEREALGLFQTKPPTDCLLNGRIRRTWKTGIPIEGVPGRMPEETLVEQSATRS